MHGTAYAVPNVTKKEKANINKTAKRIISLLCTATVLSSSAYAMKLDYYGENTVLFTQGKSELHFK